MASESQNGLEMILHLVILNHTLKYLWDHVKVDLCFAVENRKKGKEKKTQEF
jgi:hypothetical protein